jgi:hypothetical protein
MTMIIDGTNGLTFNNATTQASAGKVIQVINAFTSTSASNSTSTLADTGLTATITPKFATSTILVLVSQNGITKNPSATGSGLQLQLLRGSTILKQLQGYAGYTESNSYNWIGGVSTSYMDSPATTSATTYKTQFKNEANIASVSIQSDNSMSTITLMEISA